MAKFAVSSARGVFFTLVMPSIIGVATAAGAPTGTAFTYQGSLNRDGSVVTGAYEFIFELYGTETGGTRIGNRITLSEVPVVSSIFSVELDFGAAPFLREERWLQIQVQKSRTPDPFETLPRQKLNPTPFAVAALGLGLPLAQTDAHGATLLSLSNSGSGSGAEFYAQANGGFTLSYGVIGKSADTKFQAAGVRGEATAASGIVIGVEGVATNSTEGTGIVGRGGATGAYVEGKDPGSTGLFAYGKALGAHAECNGTGSALLAVGHSGGNANATLRITNDESASGQCQYAVNNSAWATAHLQNNGTGENLWLQRTNTSPVSQNFIVASMTGDPTPRFWLDKDGVTHTRVLEILGGSDLSEKFDVEDEAGAIEPGSVVSIDADHEGRLVLSRTPYDHRVAGIVSGAGGIKTGMLMGQQGSPADGKQAVALTGRVYCLATTENGPIRPGDLLTTSSVPGCAMRVDDPARAQGAIIGKAMGRLESGQGLLLVLVGLQ